MTMTIRDTDPILLLIDAGNSRIKWACVRQDDNLILPAVWMASGDMAHAEMADFGAKLRGLKITSALISNVSTDELQGEIEKQLWQLFPSLQLSRFRSSELRAGLRNGYQNPSLLGSDRFAAAIAATALYPEQALVVAVCGTATTVDGIRHTGEFVGGMILPGLQVMVKSLARNTAQLPQIAADVSLIELFADNTIQAMASGCIHAQVGAIELAMQTGKKDLLGPGAQSLRLLISGGAAPYLMPHLSASTMAQTGYFENLVLIGLLVVAKSESNAKNSEQV